jgi:hypothetical protein
MTAQQLMLPVAILVAGGAVTVALVCTRGGTVPATEAAVPVRPASPAAVPAAPPPARPPVLTPEIQARGRENAARALEAWRARLVAECWAPSAAKQPEPRQIPLTFSLSFSPEGALTGTGISEDRMTFRADVGTCLRRIPLSLRIPAPGVVLMVEVPFVLP